MPTPKRIASVRRHPLRTRHASAASAAQPASPPPLPAAVCGWTRCGDLLVCREAYGSALGLVRHAETVRDCMDALTAGPATLVGRAGLTSARGPRHGL